MLVDALPIKFAWKRGINLNIAENWTNKLSEEVEGKSTMNLCNRDILKIHGVHPVWSSLPSATREVKKAQIKARLLTGTYLLQSDKQTDLHFFNNLFFLQLLSCGIRWILISDKSLF